MKVLKKFLIGLAVFIGLILIVSLFLPSKVHVERSMTYKSKPDTLFTLINDLKLWDKWSPWHQIDPVNTKWTFSENTVGEGAWYSWTSPNGNVGNGKLVITKSEPNKYIANDMFFEDMDKSTSEFIFTESAEGTKLTWTLDADMGINPVGKFFGVMMDKMVGPDYEKGLNNLKAAVGE